LSDRELSLEQAGSLAEASFLVSGIIEKAQSTADIYLDSIRKVESNRLESISKIEEEAKARALRVSELKNAENMAYIERIVIDMLQVFDNQVNSLATQKEELMRLIFKNDLQYLIPGNSRVDE
jgi:cytidylate kinase